MHAASVCGPPVFRDAKERLAGITTEDGGEQRPVWFADDMIPSLQRNVTFRSPVEGDVDRARLRKKLMKLERQMRVSLARIEQALVRSANPKQNFAQMSIATAVAKGPVASASKATTSEKRNGLLRTSCPSRSAKGDSELRAMRLSDAPTAPLPARLCSPAATAADFKASDLGAPGNFATSVSRTTASD